MQPMLAKPFTSLVFDRWSSVYTQPKLDGDRGLAHCDGYYTPTIISRQGNSKQGLDHITTELAQLVAPNQHTIFDGELYIHDCDHATTHGIINRSYSCPEKLEVQYCIFDLADCQQTFTDRLQQLAAIDQIIKEKGLKHVSIVSTLECSSLEELDSQLAEYLAQGFEGAIVRNGASYYQQKRTSDLLKLKPRHKDWYLITGSYEEIAQDGTSKGRLGGFNLRDSDGRYFNCGGGTLLDHATRSRLWQEKESLPGRYLCVKYQNLTINGIPRHPVCCDIRALNEEH